MKKVINIALTVIVMLLATTNICIAVSNDNLIINSSFEDDLYGEGNWKFPDSENWYTEGTTEKTDISHSGKAAVLLNSGLVYQRVGLEKGVTYQLTLYLKAEKECSIGINFNDGAQECRQLTP